MTSSPYINHFIQPDTIIPDFYNPQYLNRYSYVINNPVIYNDPDGHCGGPACAIVLPVALVALVAVGIIYYSQPQVQAAGKEFINNLSNAYPHQERIERQEANYNKTFDDGLQPGPGYKTPKCGWACWSTIGSVISYIAYKVYCSADEEKCPPVNKPTSPTPTTTPTSTSTATSTNTPNCPVPRVACSSTTTPTATLSPSATPTATSSNTPTTTPTPTSTPPVNLLSIEERRSFRRGLLE